MKSTLYKRGQSESGWKDPSSHVRSAWARELGHLASRAQQELLFTDASPAVRKALAENAQCTFTYAQMLKGTRDDDTAVALAWLKRTDVQWKNQHIQQGLHSAIPEIRKAWEQVAQRQKYQKNETHALSEDGAMSL